MSAGDFTQSLQLRQNAGKARIFNSRIGKFTQPDTIIPGAANPQAFNRYAYVLNNPVNFVDPSGHEPSCVRYLDNQCVVSKTNAGNSVVRDLVPERSVGKSSDQQVEPEPCYGLPSYLYQCDGPIGWIEDRLVDVAKISQEVAKFMSGGGALAEGVGTLMGCGLLDAGLAGCIQGFRMGNLFHRTITNPIESWLGTISLYSTALSDLLNGSTRADFSTGNLVIGEATATSYVTYLIGKVNKVGIVDFAIDAYAVSYNDGEISGVTMPPQPFILSPSYANINPGHVDGNLPYLYIQIGED